MKNKLKKVFRLYLPCYLSVCLIHLKYNWVHLFLFILSFGSSHSCWFIVWLCGIFTCSQKSRLFSEKHHFPPFLFLLTSSHFLYVINFIFWLSLCVFFFVKINRYMYVSCLPLLTQNLGYYAYCLVFGSFQLTINLGNHSFSVLLFI